MKTSIMVGWNWPEAHDNPQVGATPSHVDKYPPEGSPGIITVIIFNCLQTQEYVIKAMHVY